jgi:hypothetical protein
VNWTVAKEDRAVTAKRGKPMFQITLGRMWFNSILSILMHEMVRDSLELEHLVAIPRPSLAPKVTGLHPKEFAALREVSKSRAVELRLLTRLKKFGLVDQRSGVWGTTQQGHILLMFAAAH